MVTVAAPLRRPHVVAVAAGTVAFAGVYTLFALLQHRELATNFDVVIFDQAVAHYAHLAAPLSAAKGVHVDAGAQFNVLGDHFSPIFALLAPFYRLWPDVRLLLVAQAVLFAASVPLVWLFTRRLLGARAAYAIAVAYGLSFGLQAALAHDVHEVAFAVPLIALALEREQAGRAGQAALAASATVFVKEDFGLFVAAFGVFLLIRGSRRLGAALLVGGVGAFVVTTKVLIPAFAGGRTFAYFSETALGGSIGEIAGNAVRDPLKALRLWVDPAAKWHTLLWLLAPWGFASLASPIAILAVPLLAVRFYGTNPHWWSTAFHYDAPLIPIVAMGAVDGVARLLRRAPARRRRALAGGWAAAAALAAVGLSATLPLSRLAAPAEWTLSPWQRAAYAAAAQVPDGATVEAISPLGPHLVDRTRTLLLDRTPRGAPWVVAQTRRQVFPFDSAAQQAQRVALLRRHGYRTVWARDGYVVLRRP